MVRAKMRITSVLKSAKTTGQIHAYAVVDPRTPENERYHKYTPCAHVEMTIDNPSAFKFFEDRIGQCVYVDFSEAPEE